MFLIQQFHQHGGGRPARRVNKRCGVREWTHDDECFGKFVTSVSPSLSIPKSERGLESVVRSPKALDSQSNILRHPQMYTSNYRIGQRYEMIIGRVWARHQRGLAACSNNSRFPCPCACRWNPFAIPVAVGAGCGWSGRALPGAVLETACAWISWLPIRGRKSVGLMK